MVRRWVLGWEKRIPSLRCGMERQQGNCEKACEGVGGFGKNDGPLCAALGQRHNGLIGFELQCCGPSYFLGGAMVSLATLATRNLTTVLALILMVSPV